MDSLVKEAPNKFKLNYNLFRLDPQEKDIMRSMQNKKRNFYNPGDPYFKRKLFTKNCNGVYNTDKVLGVISPRDHSAWLNISREEISRNSKEMMSQVCDKDREFYGGTMGSGSLTTSPRNGTTDHKPMRKHD